MSLGDQITDEQNTKGSLHTKKKTKKAKLKLNFLAFV